MTPQLDAIGLVGSDRDQIERVVEQLHDVLGADVLASYLFGSAVEGELRPRSDLDLLAISRVRATQRQKHRLVSRLLDISSPMTDRGSPRAIDLTVVVASEIRPWR
jgi:predicted nucleotidyltransferase